MSQIQKITIQKITIQNFQSHENTIIIPASNGQLTVIVGQSRQGKTAIFRALRWLFYNAPDGDDFIRWGCTFARVTVEYADGSQVIRYRTSGGTNRYIIRKPGSQEQVYEGFGRGVVPLEVQQVTGVSPVEIGEGLTLNLNLAEQLDGPFLGNKAISSTGRAKVLGKLAGTEEVDLAAKQLGTDLYRWRQDEKRLENEVVLLNEQIAGFEWLEPFKETIDNLCAIRDTINAASGKRDKLAGLLQEIKATELAMEEAANQISTMDCIIRGTQDNVHLAEMSLGRLRTLEALKSEIGRNTALLNAAQGTINKTERVRYAEEIFAGAERVTARLISVKRVKENWDAITNTLKSVQKILDATGDVPDAGVLANRIDEIVIRKKAAAALFNSWSSVQKGMNDIAGRLRRTEKIQKACEEVALVEERVAKIIELASAKTLIKKCNESILKELSAINGSEAEIENLTEEYCEVLRQSGKCPVCGGEINYKKIKEVI
jgi:exonuclease SbcC